MHTYADVAHGNTRPSSTTLQTEPCEICFSNHLGFEQLSSDERASFVSKTEICNTWAEIPCSPHSHPQVGAITGTVFLMCVSVYLSAVECTSFISSPLKSGLSSLCWAQVSLYTYMSSFLQIISLHKEVVHSKCCRGLGWWALSAWLNLWLPSKST